MLTNKLVVKENKIKERRWSYLINCLITTNEYIGGQLEDTMSLKSYNYCSETKIEVKETLRK